MKTKQHIHLPILMLLGCLFQCDPDALGQEAQPPQPFSPADALAIRRVSQPTLSPEGTWIAYTLSWLDLEKDQGRSDIFMISLDGSQRLRLTQSEHSDHSPQWSPDGRFLAFISDRRDDTSQLFLLDRRGGEAVQWSEMKGGVSEFRWSPDSKKVVLLSKDPDPDSDDKSEGKKEEKTPPPIVINRLQFKQDGIGFLKELYTHLYVLELGSSQSRQITSGPYDDSDAVWSPDGSSIAFVSNRTEAPDSNHNTDIFVVPFDGGELRQITSSPGPDSSPSWSPDGRQIAYVTSDRPERIWYATRHIARVDLVQLASDPLTGQLDRNVSSPRFSRNGDIYFLLEDSGNQHLCRIPAGSREIERAVGGERDVEDFDVHETGSLAALISEPHLPGELFLQSGELLRKVSQENSEILSKVSLGEVENIHFRSQDGTEIEGFVTKPPDFQTGARYPTIRNLHGGPVSQFSTAFNPEWQVLAGAGFVVVAANPRGSSGYGEEFSHAIWSDWGNLDYQDVMAAVDHVIEVGYADPARLGVGGWSYGGILTNYVITKTDRFKAAISGASETNYLACYGTDHYQREWETELGLPWENRELYLKLSPLTYVQNIVTPTLILCGERDWNVPLNQSEQLYQSLRRLGRETQLIVYPGQGHGIRTPSYQKDRYDRNLAWYAKYLD